MVFPHCEWDNTSSLFAFLSHHENNHQAVLFGGMQRGRYSSDVYVLDLAQMVS
jgi:hypothetical protein